MSVLVGYQSDPYGEAALTRAIDEAVLRDLPLHVMSSVAVEQPGSSASAQGQSRGLSKREADLEAIAERARTAGVKQVDTHFALESRGEGQFLHDLLDLIDRTQATLVVIGIRDRSRVGKLVLGSRAQDVLLHVDCPVLAVKPPTQD